MRIRTRPLRPVALVLVLLVVGVGVTAQTASAGGGADARAITSLLRKQTALFNTGRWQALWRTYTPRFRRGCSYRLWRAEQLATRRAIGAPIAVRAIRVRVTGRRAKVTYTLLLGGQAITVVRPARPDLYVKLGRRWYDEGDGITTCRAGVA